MIKSIDMSHKYENSYIMQSIKNEWEHQWVGSLGLKNSYSGNNTFWNNTGNYGYSNYGYSNIDWQSNVKNYMFNNFKVTMPKITPLIKPTTISKTMPKTVDLMKKQGFFGKLEREVKLEYAKLTSDVNKTMDKFGFFKGSSKFNKMKLEARERQQFLFDSMQGKYGKTLALWNKKFINNVETNAPNRWPDYITIGGNIGKIVGWNGEITLDRYGNVYWSPGGFGIGKSTLVAPVSVGISWGWLNKSGIPSRNVLNKFLSGNSVTISGGMVVGGGVTWSSGMSGKEYGFYTPQVGVSYHYTQRKGHLPLMW
jgi:hypothetical protein